MKAVNYFERPFVINPTVKGLTDWLRRHKIIVLNVAGNRKSKNPDVVGLVRRTLTEALQIINGKQT